jgi:hypothetical protein
LEASKQTNLAGVINIVIRDAENHSKLILHHARIARIEDGSHELAVLIIEELAGAAPLGIGVRFGHREKIAAP